MAAGYEVASGDNPYEATSRNEAAIGWILGFGKR